MPTVTLNPDAQTQTDITRALRKLSRMVEDNGTPQVLNDKMGYIKPTTRRRKSLGAAKARQRRESTKRQLPPRQY